MKSYITSHIYIMYKYIQIYDLDCSLQPLPCHQLSADGPWRFPSAQAVEPWEKGFTDSFDPMTSTTCLRGSSKGRFIRSWYRHWCLYHCILPHFIGRAVKLPKDLQRYRELYIAHTSSLNFEHMMCLKSGPAGYGLGVKERPTSLDRQVDQWMDGKCIRIHLCI